MSCSCFKDLDSWSVFRLSNEVQVAISRNKELIEKLQHDEKELEKHQSMIKLKDSTITALQWYFSVLVSNILPSSNTLDCFV